jgi:single-strand DNA-binding protein
MSSLNRLYLMGNLTKDPEVKYLPDGTAVADLRLAVNESYKSRTTGETMEQTCFVDVVAWRKQAETCGQYLSKGSQVLVEGRLHLDEWDAQDGTKRSRLRVRAQRVQFLGSPRNTTDAPSDGGTQPGTSKPPADAPAANTASGSGEADGLGDDDNLPF